MRCGGSLGDVVAQCGMWWLTGFVMSQWEMWWLTGMGYVVAHWFCDVSLGDVVVHWELWWLTGVCGGSLHGYVVAHWEI